MENPPNSKIAIFSENVYSPLCADYFNDPLTHKTHSVPIVGSIEYGWRIEMQGWCCWSVRNHCGGRKWPPVPSHPRWLTVES